MSKTPLQLAGVRSGRLVGIKPVEQNSLKQWKWLCKCDCGNTSVVLGSRINTGSTNSCGCLAREKTSQRARTHGLSKTPEYKLFLNAKTRCTNKNRKQWPDYGGRGIKFLFTSFEQFLAELGPRPSPKHSVERLDNEGHYEPGNVAWATREEQNRNQRPRKVPCPRSPDTGRFVRAS
jgi:hypothetical protein